MSKKPENAIRAALMARRAVSKQIPGIQTPILISPISVGEMFAIDDKFTGESAAQNRACARIAASVVDEDNEPIFANAEDVKASLDFATFNALYGAVAEVNGLKEATKEKHSNASPDAPHVAGGASAQNAG